MLRQISSRPALFRTGLRYFDVARSEGKKFKYIPVENNPQPLSKGEITELLEDNGTVLTDDIYSSRFDNVQDFLLKHYGTTVFGKKLPTTTDEQKIFLETLRDPVLAHIVDYSAIQYRKKIDTDSTSFMNRLKNAFDGSKSTYVNYVVPDEQVEAMKKLDKIHIIQHPSTEVSAKIKENYYNYNLVDEDETTTYSPTLTEEYNNQNVLLGLATQSPELLKKAAKSKKVYESLVTNPNDSLKLNKMEFIEHKWAKDLLNEKWEKEAQELIDNQLSEEQVQENFEAYKKTFRDRAPKEIYDSHIDLVNDFFRKYETSEGLIRVAPDWFDQVHDMGYYSAGKQVPPTDGLYFPEGIVIVKVAKYIKVRDRFITGEEVHKEMKTLTLKQFLLEELDSPYNNDRDDSTMKYLAEGTGERYLIVNLRYGTYTIAHYDGETLKDMMKAEQDSIQSYDDAEALYDIPIDQSLFYTTPDVTVKKITPEWCTKFKSVAFPAQSGYSRFSASFKLWKYMANIIQLLRTDNNPLRTDMSLHLQKLPYVYNEDHPTVAPLRKLRFFDYDPYESNGDQEVYDRVEDDLDEDLDEYKNIDLNSASESEDDFADDEDLMFLNEEEVKRSSRRFRRQEERDYSEVLDEFAVESEDDEKK